MRLSALFWFWFLFCFFCFCERYSLTVTVKWQCAVLTLEFEGRTDLIGQEDLTKLPMPLEPEGSKMVFPVNVFTKMLVVLFILSLLDVVSGCIHGCNCDVDDIVDCLNRDLTELRVEPGTVDEKKKVVSYLPN